MIGTCNCLPKGIDCDMHPTQEDSPKMTYEHLKGVDQSEWFEDTQETWEEMFDKEFGENMHEVGCDAEYDDNKCDCIFGKFKSFITQVREEATKEAYEKARGGEA